MPAQPTDPAQEHAGPVIPGENWDAQRREILARVLATLGPFPAERCALEMEVLNVTRDHAHPMVERRHIRFRADHDDWITAFLCVPLDQDPPRPAVVCFHPTTTGGGKNEVVGLPSTDGKFTYPDCAYGLELAMHHHYVTLSIDQRFDGERLAPGEPRYDSTRFQAKYPGWSPLGKMAWDGSRAVDLLASLPGLDGSRIGVIGHSLGAHCALFTAAFDPRVKACVCNGGIVSWRQDSPFHWARGGWGDGRYWAYMPKARAFLEDNSIPYPWTFLELASTLAPRAALYMLIDDESDAQAFTDFLGGLIDTYTALEAEDAIDLLTYPGGHSFPVAARAKAYELLDRVLVASNGRRAPNDEQK
jgi:hypothetical protein